jgi:hypothetical protein
MYSDSRLIRGALPPRIVWKFFPDKVDEFP